MYFWPDFLSHDLRSFSSIPSMDLDARTSIIIYLHPWSESMTLAPPIDGFLPIPPKPSFFEPKSKEKSLDLGKTTLRTYSLH
jgi:hypothetical protein